jgi:hypothetical protein
MNTKLGYIRWRSTVTGLEGGGSVPVSDPAETVDELNRRYPNLRHWWIPARPMTYAQVVAELNRDFPHVKHWHFPWKAMTNDTPNYSSAPIPSAMSSDTTINEIMGHKKDAELAIIEAIQNFERLTDLVVDGIDYDRPGIFGSISSPVLVKIRAMVP